MKLKAIKILIAIALGSVLSLAASGSVDAKEKKLKPEEVVAAHLKSLGTPELLASIKSRGISGKASVEFIQGGVGTMVGQSMVISEASSLSVIMKFGGADYPGEYFAFDGTDVNVANMRPGQKSPLADFIYRYNGMMKEGLLGGVLSVGWPLLDLGKMDASLKYFSAKVEGGELHGIEYTPKRDMNRVKVKLFFEPDTFRHVRTEYALKVEGEQALQADQTVTLQGPTSRTGRANGQSDSGPITKSAGILDPVRFSYYLLVEKFDNFKEVKVGDSAGGETRNLTLPHSYTLEYSVEGQGSTFIAHWKIAADQWVHNLVVDPVVFKVH
jgi:hypothetical protein